MLSSSSPTLTPRTVVVHPPIPAGHIPAHRLSTNGIHRLHRHGPRPKLPNGGSNIDCARFRLRRKKGTPFLDVQKDMARQYRVEKQLDGLLVSSVKRIAVTNSRIRQCRQLHLDPSPFIPVRLGLYLENKLIRRYRDRLRTQRGTISRLLALVEHNDHTISQISAFSLLYRSAILSPSLIQFPSSHPTPTASSPVSPPSNHDPIGVPAMLAHRLNLKRTWDAAFAPIPPDPSFRTFVDFDGTAQHVAVGSHLSDHGIGLMTCKRRRI